MGNNPVWHNDALGDKWGEKGNAESEKYHKAIADGIKENYKKKLEGYKKTVTDKEKELIGLDKNSKDYKTKNEELKEAKMGVQEMQKGINELEAMEKDTKNYFVFNQFFGRSKTGEYTAKQNNDKTNTIYLQIPIGGRYGLKSHEVLHGYFITAGITAPDYKSADPITGITNMFYFLQYDKGYTGVKQEVLCYLRQYFAGAKDEMPGDFKGYKLINEDYLKTIKDASGNPLY